MQDNPGDKKNNFQRFTVLKAEDLLFRRAAQLTSMAIACIILFSLISCSRIFDTASDDSTSDSTSAVCTLSVSLDGITGSAAPASITASEEAAVLNSTGTSRSAFPDLSGGTYKAKLWESASGTEGSTWTAPVTSEPLTFVIDSAEAVEYNIRLGFFSSSSDTTPAFYTTDPASFTVTKGILTASCTVSILPGVCTAGDGTTTKGSISLVLDPATEITVSGVTMQNSEGTDLVSYSDSTITGSNVSAGKYTLTITASDSGSNTFTLPEETVYVWPGLTTDTWYTGASSGYSDKLTISPSSRTWFCVSGNGGSLAEGDDDTGDGGFANPFATVQHAVSLCTDTTVNGSSGTGYTIYIDGEIKLTSTSGSISVDGSKKITFSGLNGSDDDIIDGGYTSGGTDGCQILSIASGSTVTIENLTLQKGYSNYGGGIYIKSSNCIIKEGTVITGNTATSNAGGIDNEGGTITINGGTISGNTSQGTTGGGINNYSSGTIIMTAGTISGNTAKTYGGGVNLESGNFTMSGGTISGNTATSGGSVNVCPGGTLTLSGSGTINGNTAASNGGGIYNDGTVTMDGGSITSNTVSDSSGGAGGGLYNTGTFTMNDGTITLNTGMNGGGAYIGGSFTMTGGTISSNTATANGGGLFNSSKSFIMTGGTISNNKASMTGGGIWQGGSFIISGGILTGNMADFYGNGIYESAYSTVFKMSGSAVIDAETDGANDVYLDIVETITIAGNLSPENTTLSSGKAATISARITPASYTAGTAVLIDGGSYLGSNYTKLTVTPQEESTPWYINSDGKLTTTQP
jgi:hypothetical protein